MLRQTPTRWFFQTSHKIPLRLILIIPFVLEIFAAVGLTGYLSLRNGQEAVNNVATRLRGEITHRIEDRLNSYLATPPLVNRINENAIRHGTLDLNDFSSWQTYLFQQIQLFDAVNYIYFGSEQGEYVGVGSAVDKPGIIEYAIVSNSHKGILYKYSLDQQGNFDQEAKNIYEYDPRVRPWYQAPIQAGKPQWSEIYEHFVDGDDQEQVTLGISFGHPFYDDSGTLQGVLSVDFTLSQISEFLSNLEVGKSGKTFIVERSGLLVATSTSKQPFFLNPATKKLERISAVESEDMLISAAAKHLIEREELREISKPEQIKFKINGQRHFLQVTPFTDNQGIEWLIFVVIPEADFMEQINAHTRTTIILCLGALGLTTGLGILTSGLISKPIFHLIFASQAIAKGELNQRVKVKRIKELGVLAESFNQMARQLEESFMALGRTNEELENRVDERTKALQVADEKFVLAFRASPDPITITTLVEGKFIDVNDSFLSTSGYSLDEVVNHTIDELNNWVDSEQRAKIRQLLEEQSSIRNQEFEFRIKSGEVRTGLFSAEVINISGQKCLLSVINDITDRKKAKEALAESQRTLSTLMSNLPGMAYRSLNDQDWTMKFVSEGCYELTGHQPEDLIDNKNISYNQLIYLEDQDRVRQKIQTAIAEGMPFQIVYRIITVDKKLKWVWEQGQGVFSSEGKLLTIEGFTTDVTARREAEESLREKEEYLRLILDNIPQQVFWKDTNLVFLGCNKNWAKASGFDSPEAVIGKTDYDLLPSREIAELYRAQDRKVIESNQSELNVIRGKEKPLDEGQQVWLDISKIPIHDVEGKVVGILGVLEDITQRKLAEEALRVEQEKSERLLLNILPKAIAERLKQDTSAIAENFDEATILFADIVGFTPLSARMHPIQLVNLLNEIFSTFDQLAQQHSLEKIKTIGDAYMVVGGLPLKRHDHAEAVAAMALDMQLAVRRFQVDKGESFQIRIGINTGPVVAGVIGINKFIYDLWGDTVNIASRMESQGFPGKIQVTDQTYHCLKNKYLFEKRGAIAVKGRGEIVTHWLTGKKA
ncbi:MAG: adenylate/guanylate cyclase domain-containing protein [Coleofasciculaceae cyanobacterium]